MDRFFVIVVYVVIVYGYWVEVIEQVDLFGEEFVLFLVIDFDMGICYCCFEELSGDIFCWIGWVLECIVMIGGIGVCMILLVDLIGFGVIGVKIVLCGVDVVVDVVKVEVDRWGGVDWLLVEEFECFW